MKIVSGKVKSTIPISLSDAAKSLSKFAASDHEASHAVSLYLQRAADSFNKLVKVHQKLSLKKEHSTDDIEISERKNREVGLKVENIVKNEDIPNGFGEIKKRKNLVKEENVEADTKLIKTEKFVEMDMEQEDMKRKKKKKKKKDRGVDDSEHEVVKVEEDLGNKAEEEGKKRKSMDSDAGENAGSTEQISKKKSKKRRIEGEK